MKISVITLFPEVFKAYLSESIMKRAIEGGLLSVDLHNLRDFARDKHRTVDDYPYGGGPGMVLKPEPLAEAVGHVKEAEAGDTLTVLMSPDGAVFDQAMALALSREKRRLLLICGRYEAVDERVRQALVDKEISIGDYVLTGGELPALVIIDAVARLVPGVLGAEASLKDESFNNGLLDYPHYTRPPEWQGMAVPETLLSGDHKRIDLFRRKQALRRTLKRRPDLLSGASLTEFDKKMILEIKEEADEFD